MQSLERYSRQILFAGLRKEGQERLHASRVLLCGCGALWTVLAETLAAWKCFERVLDRSGAKLASTLELVVSDGAEQHDAIGHALLVPTGRAGVSEYAVFLRQDHRGRGLGTALNRAAIDAAREAGLKGLWLSVEPHNRAALRSYEKAGFTLLPGTLFSPEAEMQLTL